MCKYCERKYVADDSASRWLERRYNETLLVEGCWTVLYIGVDKDNRLIMRACGDDYTDDYYPKYCPECGRRLIDHE